jgi:hypothetical protein
VHSEVRALLLLVLLTVTGCAPPTGEDATAPGPASTAPAPASPASPPTSATPAPASPTSAPASPLSPSFTAPLVGATIDPLPDVALPRQGSGRAVVRITRRGYRGPLDVRIDAVEAPDVVFGTAIIPADATSVEVTIDTRADLLVTTATVHVSATDDLAIRAAIRAEASFTLTVGDTTSQAFGSFDARLGGRGYIPLEQYVDMSDLVRADGGRVLVVSDTCNLSRYDVATASLDPTFGSNGLVRLAVPGACLQLGRAADGALIVTTLTTNGAVGAWTLVRLRENGEVDRVEPEAAISPGTLSWTPSTSVALADGTTLLVGNRPTSADEDPAYVVVMAHAAADGSIDEELDLPRFNPLEQDIDGETLSEWPSWTHALPNGDVMLAVMAGGNDTHQLGAIVRLVHPTTNSAAWHAKLIVNANGFPVSSFDDDDSFFVPSTPVQAADGSWGCALTLVNPDDSVAAYASRVGPKVQPPGYWWEIGNLIPVGDGTALTVAHSSYQANVLARVWIRP